MRAGSPVGRVSSNQPAWIAGGGSACFLKFSSRASAGTLKVPPA
jgi:hypothetical protein